VNEINSIKEFSWFQVPEDVKKLLVLAANNWENSESQDNIDVLIAAYRFFFYKNNYLLALQVAEKVIAAIKKSESFPESWDELKLILSAKKNEYSIRLYLNAYSASGLVLAKLGNLEQAKIIASRVKELDDKNEFGASVLLKILYPSDEEN
jgi:tetratricopeptide (TPR) repeat protein